MGPVLNKITIPEQQKVLFRIGHDSIRLVKWMACFDKYYENLNCFNLLSSVLSCVNEISYL